LFTAPLSSPGTRRYSLEWAKTVVQGALDTHARVSKSFLESTQITPSELAHWLSQGAIEWVRLRDMLKWLDLCKQPPRDTTHLLSYYVETYGVRFPNSLLEHLTGALDAVPLKSSEQAGGGRIRRKPKPFASDLFAAEDYSI